MANQDEMKVVIKCNKINKAFMEFHKKDITETLKELKYDKDIIDKYYDCCDENFLGILPILFIKPNEVSKFIKCYDIAWRSFIQYMDYDEANQELTLYYLSGDGGDKDFFKTLHKTFPDKIQGGVVTISDDLYDEEREFLIDDYGEDFEIKF